MKRYALDLRLPAAFALEASVSSDISLRWDSGMAQACLADLKPVRILMPGLLRREPFRV